MLPTPSVNEMPFCVIKCQVYEVVTAVGCGRECELLTAQMRRRQTGRSYTHNIASIHRWNQVTNQVTDQPLLMTKIVASRRPRLDQSHPDLHLEFQSERPHVQTSL